ncbi:MAG TPA: hypothetical protein VHH35_18155 [Pyrinomonadaceae bacterium]|nr:hypothetical protein [Pyrinomonadaceae bacterium]
MNTLFSRAKPIVGVIHVGALPGTPRSSQSVSELAAFARHEARIYREAGVDGFTATPTGSSSGPRSRSTAFGLTRSMLHGWPVF